MSLDISFHLGRCPHCARSDGAVWEGNITYNLGAMRRAAGVPLDEGIEGKPAGDLVPQLEAALASLLADPVRFKAMNPSNGWGSYSGLVDFVTRMLAAAREYPDAIVETSR